MTSLRASQPLHLWCSFLVLAGKLHFARAAAVPRRTASRSILFRPIASAEARTHIAMAWWEPVFSVRVQRFVETVREALQERRQGGHA